MVKRAKILLKIFTFLSAVLLIVGFSYAGWIWYLSGHVELQVQHQNSDLINQNGSQLTSLAHIPPIMSRGLIAELDPGFYDHSGFNLIRKISNIFRSVALKDRSSYSSSTLTEQLVANLPSVGFKTALDTALTQHHLSRELATILFIEQNFSKDEILAMHLNTMAFGRNAFGVEAAARTFFNKSALDLDTNESALLIGMLKSTTFYDPIRRPEKALIRRNDVPAKMVTNKLITLIRYDSLSVKPLGLRYNSDRF